MRNSQLSLSIYALCIEPTSVTEADGGQELLESLEKSKVKLGSNSRFGKKIIQLYPQVYEINFRETISRQSPALLI